MEKKKRIGVFTYMLSNYGAVLQCFALQNYLRNNTSHKVEVIDFTTVEHQRSIKILGRKSENPVKNVALNLLTLRYYLDLRRRQKRTELFKKNRINYSLRYPDMNRLLTNPPDEDVYVTGSDQVFNLNSRYVDVYYLNFKKGNARKVAYAPSFGVASFNDEYRSRVPEYIKDFDALSCREQTGADFLSELTGKDIPVVVDPTMLLTADEWLKVAVEPDYKDYILIYDLNGRENLILIATEIQRQTGYKIVCITDNTRNHYKVDKIVLDAGPAEFVGWFAKANFIVTDSFHGTSFALKFNKPFSTYIATPKTADRLYTLLGYFDMCWRLIENGEAGDFSASKEFLHQPDVDTSDFAKSSYQFINDNILNI